MAGLPSHLSRLSLGDCHTLPCWHGWLLNAPIVLTQKYIFFKNYSKSSNKRLTQYGRHVDASAYQLPATSIKKWCQTSANMHVCLPLPNQLPLHFIYLYFYLNKGEQIFPDVFILILHPYLPSKSMQYPVTWIWSEYMYIPLQFPAKLGCN